MGKIFEDEFMDIQSGIISLCLEALNDIKADKIFAYASMEKYSTSFNAFFEINGEIKTTNKTRMPVAIQRALLREGISDLEKIRKVCEKYKQPCPTEMKMYYEVGTKKYQADYKYEPVCCAETGVDISEVFLAWVDEVKKNKQEGKELI